MWFSRACCALLIAEWAKAAEPQPFGRFLDLGNHRIHYHCEGQGSTTVILLTGTPRFSFHFALVQPGIGKFARVCTYDRAGDAWSAPVPNQPQAQMFVDELHQILNRIVPNVQPGVLDTRVILVGHSVGGVLARAYASQHAERLAALVLIDSTPVPSERPTDELLRAQAAKLDNPTPAAQPSLAVRPPFDKLPARFREAHVWATNKWNRYAASVDPFVGLQYQADLYHLASQAPRNIPVWFLARATPAGWANGQREMAAQWPHAKLVLIPNAGHDIELDHPAAVIEAVRQAAGNRR